MKTCQVCHSKVAEDLETCSGCGEASFAETDPAAEPSSPPDKTPKGKGSKKAKRASFDDAPETDPAAEPSSPPDNESA
jgi:hypothetical protein